MKTHLILGKLTEDFVAEKLGQLGCQILARDFRAVGTQIDLLAKFTDGQFYVVEVKRVSSLAYIERRVSWVQRARLERATRALSAKHCSQMGLCFAFANHQTQEMNVFNCEGDRLEL